MTEQDDPAGRGWHLDKRIPVALILALIFQFAGGVYWVTSLESRTLNNRERIARLEEQMDPVRLTLERIDQRLQWIVRRLDREQNGDPRNGP